MPLLGTLQTCKELDRENIESIYNDELATPLALYSVRQDRISAQGPYLVDVLKNDWDSALGIPDHIAQSISGGGQAMEQVSIVPMMSSQLLTSTRNWPFGYSDSR